MHRNGVGKMKTQDCHVRFDFYIPLQWHRFPYMLLVGRGDHTHFPPPPTKLPYELQADLMACIADHNVLELTTRTLMLSPLLQVFLKKHGQEAIWGIHGSLAIGDRITALIRKQKLLSYPGGSDLAGVLREYQLDQSREPKEQWIRDIYFFDDERQYFMIICCTYEQAKAFQKQQHIEMDLAFKTVNGKTMVYSIAAYNSDARQINTYAYVYINLEKPWTYKILFQRLFQILGDVGRKPIIWAYQNGLSDSSPGIRTVTLDMSKSQARGFGEYLVSKTQPKTKYSGLSWNEHLFYVMVFCETHIKRAFFKKWRNHPAMAAVDQILRANSIHHVHAIIKDASEAWPETAKWFKNKDVPWILAGMTKEASKIPINWWILAQHHTGSCESSHFMDNEAVGRKRSLLGAILGYDLCFSYVSHMTNLS